MYDKDKLGTDICVHCTTLEEAIKLLKWADKEGFRWGGIDEERYNSKTPWKEYQENTVYYISEGMFGNVDYAGRNNHSILSMKDIRLNKTYLGGE